MSLLRRDRRPAKKAVAKPGPSVGLSFEPKAASAWVRPLAAPPVVLVNTDGYNKGRDPFSASLNAALNHDITG